MNKLAILQPNYIPWKGVFDLIDRVDDFVFYDDVQYTKKDWRNRNIIKSKNHDILLTVPVKTKGKRTQLIKDVKIDNNTGWQKKHYKSILNSYKNSNFLDKYHNILEELYLKKTWSSLSDLNIFSTKLIAKSIGITANWHLSSSLAKLGTKDGEKIIEICKELKCNFFINGPASKKFLNESLFKVNNIDLKYMNYNYPEYDQLHPPFCHNVSILDLIFNCGPKSIEFIRQ